VLDRGCGQSV